MLLTVARLNNKKKPKKKSVEVEEPATTATPINDPSISERQSVAAEKERESLRLEEDLDAAVRNASGAGAGAGAGDDGSKPAEEGKFGYSGLM